MDDELGTRQAAAALGVTRMTILQHLASGKLQGRRTATGTWRIPRAEVARLTPPKPPSVDALTVREAADALGVTTTTVRRWLNQGVLTPSAPRRRGIRIAAADVAQWKAARQATRAAAGLGSPRDGRD